MSISVHYTVYTIKYTLYGRGVNVTPPLWCLLLIFQPIEQMCANMCSFHSTSKIRIVKWLKLHNYIFVQISKQTTIETIFSDDYKSHVMPFGVGSHRIQVIQHLQLLVQSQIQRLLNGAIEQPGRTVLRHNVFVQHEILFTGCLVHLYSASLCSAANVMSLN